MFVEAVRIMKNIIGTLYLHQLNGKARTIFGDAVTFFKSSEKNVSFVVLLWLTIDIVSI